MHALTLTTFWQVWKMTNAKAFNGEMFSLAGTRREALVEHNIAMAEFAKEKEAKGQKHMGIGGWAKPRMDQIKVHRNGAWSIITSKARIGYIIKDNKGDALMAAAVHHTCPSVLYSELLAIRNAID